MSRYGPDPDLTRAQSARRRAALAEERAAQLAARANELTNVDPCFGRLDGATRVAGRAVAEDPHAAWPILRGLGGRGGRVWLH